ncbi:MAG: hypothetical protein M1819_003496 [Sarea resinae]|nr:MAG: hypothetical protein M1819_003496 [Sarea resinae]
MATPSAEGEGNSKPDGRKLQLMDLPVETQKEILKHVETDDLIALALVSRRFHEIASAELYRDFTIVFGDEDDPDFTLTDSLAGGLDTLVSSDYNYAQHLKDITLDTLSGGEKGEKAYRHCLYDSSCGKFLNTLLYLTLKKAKALETFHWNIRIELSRPVFRALHKLPCLQHLHVRLQAGVSQYETPPPLPSLANPHVPPLTISFLPLSSPLFPQPSSSSLNASLPKPPKAPSKERPEKPEPPTFSGFKSLSSLGVLDMDTLDYVPELEACIRASSSSLKKLKLSFSEALAQRARKPQVYDSDDSDQEMDEFGNTLPPPPPPPPPAAAPDLQPVSTAADKDARARAELSAQQAVLGRLFGFDKAPPTKDSSEDEAEKPPPPPPIDENLSDVEKYRKFFEELKTAMVKLIELTSVSPDNTAKMNRAMDAFEQAAVRYLKASEHWEQGLSDAEKSAAPGPSTTETQGPEIDIKASGVAADDSEKNAAESSTNSKGKEKALDSKSSAEEAKEEEDASTDGPGLFDNPTIKPTSSAVKVRDTMPEDIDIDHPDVDVDVDDEGEDQEIEEPPANADTNAESENLAGAPNGLQVTEPLATTDSNTDITMSGGQAALGSEPDLAAGPGPAIHDESAMSKEQLESLTREELPKREGVKTPDEEIQEYIRSTRKIPLQTLALYLVPIKASVLSRAIDLTTLKRLTLLNVGPQTAFWALMTTTQNTTPLSLRSIYTDNVSSTFLAFVNSLDKLTEVFMLERSSKAKVESLAPKTTVKIEDIRKLVLKKHIKTLTRLMIKNENDYSWDVNCKTIRLLTRKGSRLAELAISMDLTNFHLLLQSFSGLENLKAFHILGFRTEDTCTWVLRELRRFAVDNIAHNPHMKLEYIALDNTLERLIRRPRKPKKAKKAQALADPNQKLSTNGPPSAGPPSDTIVNGSSGSGNASPSTADGDSSSEDSDDLDSVASGAGLKIETKEDRKFYDIRGIRIFRKDVKAGRL